MTAAAHARPRPPGAGTPSRWTWLRVALAATWVVLLVGALTLGEPFGRQTAPGLASTVWGLPVPAWLGWTALASTVGALACVVGGPEPWRATRWAWFWLIGNPLGVLAFLLLAGPTPGVATPRSDRRLRGGWAFVLGSAVSAVLGYAGLR